MERRQASNKQKKGCLQGSVCGPTFWNLILDELLETPLPDGCHIQAFANDVVLLVRAKDAQEIEHKTYDALKFIFDCGQSVKLSFSPEKTQAIYFTQAPHTWTPKTISKILRPH